MFRFILSLLLTFLSLSNVNAEVINKAQNGFKLSIDKIVNVDKRTAYEAFINISSWWDPEHTWFGNAENLTLDVKAGGCFCEVNGDKSVQHMNVSFVIPNKKLTLLGGLGPLQSLGIYGAMTIEFIQIEEKTTKISLLYHVSGFTEHGLDKLAAIVDKVQTHQLERLAQKLNSL